METIVVVSGAHSGYRRAGRAFEPGENIVELSTVSEAQLCQLKADPRLVVLQAPSDGVSATGNASKSVQTLEEAFALLDPANTEHFTGSGLPQTQALSKLVGRTVNAAERDSAWAEFKAKQTPADGQV